MPEAPLGIKRSSPDSSNAEVSRLSVPSKKKRTVSLGDSCLVATHSACCTQPSLLFSRCLPPAQLTLEEEAADSFRRSVIEAVRLGDARAALDLFANMAAKNVTRTAHICNTILSLCARVIPAGDTELVARARAVFAAMPEAGIARSEAAYASVVRLCAVAGDADAAHGYLSELLAESTATPRLRTYAPLLAAFAGRGDADRAEALFRDMTGRGIDPTQAEWASMLTAFARASRERDVLATLDDMANVVFEVEPTLLAVLDAAFGAGGSGGVALGSGAAAPSVAADVVASSLPLSARGDVGGAEAAAAVATLAAAAKSNDGDGSGAVVAAVLRAAAAVSPVTPMAGWRAARVHIPPATGRCPLTGHRLRSIDLTREEQTRLATQVESLAGPQNRAFADFKAWLAARATTAPATTTAQGRAAPRLFGTPPPSAAAGSAVQGDGAAAHDCGFDVVLDGPNIGFAGQNFGGGALMYTQIRAVAAAFRARGAGVLIVMGSSWLEPSRIAETDRRRPFKRRRGGSGAGGGGRGAPAGSQGRRGTSAAASAAVSAAAAAVEPAIVDRSERQAGAAASAATASGEVAQRTAVHSALVAADGGSRERLSEVSAVDEFEADTDEEEVDDGVAGHDDDYEEEDAFAADYDEDACAPPPPLRDSTVAANADDDSRVAADVVASWVTDGLVYRVPPNNNDDWFWLYAAVAAGDDSGSVAGSAEGGATLNSQRRRPVFVVSNDLMRDHHWGMLAPRAFLKWRERHQVGYRFAWDHAASSLRPVFTFPRVYSHRAQRHPSGDTWHFPVAGTPDEWLVAMRDSQPECESGQVVAAATAVALA